MHYTFFWPGPFSNWHPSPFWDYGIEYNCVEQYMMAHKAVLFGDYDTHTCIMLSTSPKDIKAMGKKVKKFEETRWIFFRQQIVFRGCLQKFTQNGDLRQLLLDTNDSILVEASPYDRIWGIGFREKDAIVNRAQWGLNLLGNILTEVKGLLK